MASIVLCIEDNDLNMLVMKHVVKRLNDVVLLEAVNAEQGLEIAFYENVDLVIMDIQLPGMDGYEALQRLKDHNKTCHTPVIALSSFAEKVDIERGLTAGFTEYVTKPIRVAHFIETIERLLKKRGEILQDQ
ncbi:response regulator [Paenibacillus sp. GCM10028914]|uniref:response regulator n=1 Tax=Paenibacillus sp. GCM10028914 TaxID=3273416 RepID=UPI00361BEE49